VDKKSNDLKDPLKLYKLPIETSKRKQIYISSDFASFRSAVNYNIGEQNNEYTMPSIAEVGDGIGMCNTVAILKKNNRTW